MGTEILLFKEWLNEDNENLKLLLFISKDSYNHNSKYSLKSIREWLGQKGNISTNNNNNLKRLHILQEKKYISYSREGNLHHIHISINTDNKQEIKGVKKQWTEAIRNANRDKNYKKIDDNIKADWTQTFRLFVNIHIGNIRGLTTQTQIADILNVSRPTVSGALKLLNLCAFEDIKCGSRKETEKVNYKYRPKDNEEILIIYEQTRTVGTNIDYLENAF